LLHKKAFYYRATRITLKSLLNSYEKDQDGMHNLLQMPISPFITATRKKEKTKTDPSIGRAEVRRG